MNEPRSRDRPRRLALVVEAVDVLPTDLHRFLVRVAGAWEPGAGRPDGRAELVLEVDGEERRFPALPQTSDAAERAAPEAQAFRPTFSIPEALGPALGGKLRLAIGDAVGDLPAARLPGEAADAPTSATVIDRAVLAERRARRAELAEEANARRAQEAQRALRELEAELAKLEVRLEQAVTERAALEAQAAERDRDARAAAQREYAERRRREEASEEASARVRDAEAAAHELRVRLREAEGRATSLAGEVEALRRQAAEAEHAIAGADAARRRAAGPVAAAGPQGAAFPVAVMRSEAAVARLAFSAAGGGAGLPPSGSGSGGAGGGDRSGWGSGGEPTPGDDERIEHALRVVAEAEVRMRAAAEAVGRSASQLREEREAQRRLARELARERDVQRELMAALEAEREARDRQAAEAIRDREAREALARRAGELEHRVGAVVEELRAELEAVRASADAQADQPDLRQFVATAADALRTAEGRIAEAQTAAAELSGRIEQLEGQLLAERAARAAEGGGEAEAAAEDPSAEGGGQAEGASERPRPTARTPERRAAPSEPWLPAALELMIDREPGLATELMLDLVAGQALRIRGALDYRLLVADAEPRSVSLRPSRAAIARLEDDDPAAKRGFQLRTDPRGLLDLLLEGGSRKLRRRVRVSGTWRRRRALRSVPRAELRPGRLAAADIWLDPLLLLTALVGLVEPEWTAGHDFVVAHEVWGPRPRRLWVRAGGGRPLCVLGEPPPQAAAVTAQSTQSAFQRFLGGEPNGPEKWTIRGDVNVLAVLTGWLERARVRS